MSWFEKHKLFMTLSQDFQKNLFENGILNILKFQKRSKNSKIVIFEKNHREILGYRSGRAGLKNIKCSWSWAKIFEKLY